MSGRAGKPEPGSDASGLGNNVVTAIGDLEQLVRVGEAPSPSRGQFVTTAGRHAALQDDPDRVRARRRAGVRCQVGSTSRMGTGYP